MGADNAGGAMSGGGPDVATGPFSTQDQSAPIDAPSQVGGSFATGRGAYDAAVQTPGSFLSDIHPALANAIADMATKGMMSAIAGTGMPAVPGMGLNTLAGFAKGVADLVNWGTDRLGMERGVASGFPGSTGGTGTSPIDPTTEAVQAALRPQADRRVESFQANLHPHTAAVALAALKPHIAMFQHALKQGRGVG